MRAVFRTQLPSSTVEYLAQQQSIVDAKPETEQAAEAKRLWEAFRATDKQVVRNALIDMTLGHERCMYCEDSAGRDIEHVQPKSRFPQACFVWENYLWACAICNGSRKRDQWVDGFPNPTQPGFNFWDRVRLDVTTGQLVPLDTAMEQALIILGFIPDPESPKRFRNSLPERRTYRLSIVLGPLQKYATYRQKSGDEDEHTAQSARLLMSDFPALTHWLLTRGLTELPATNKWKDHKRVISAITQHFPDAWNHIQAVGKALR